MSPFMTEFQTFFSVMMAALGDFWFWFANTIIGRIILFMLIICIFFWVINLIIDLKQ